MARPRTAHVRTKNETGKGNTRSKARIVDQIWKPMSVHRNSEAAATTRTSRSEPSEPRPSRNDRRIDSSFAPIFGGSGLRNGFTRRSVRSGFAARKPRNARPRSVTRPNSKAERRSSAKRPASSPFIADGAHPTAYTTKRTMTVTRSMRRSSAMEARHGATGSPEFFARATGRTISPARAGSSVEAAKPMAVAELRARADGCPAFFRSRAQRHERKSGVPRRPAVVAQCRDGHDGRKAAAVLADVGQFIDVLDPARGLEDQGLEAWRNGG